MSFWVAGATAGLSAYSAYSSARANNEQQKLTQENAKRRYLLQSSIAEQQYIEQDSIALEQLTEVSRQMLMAKGTLKVAQAESGVSGNVEKRKSNIVKIKESEAKGKVVRDVQTNKINVAQDMLAKKIDTEAIIAESKAREISSANIAISTISAGIKGYAQGYNLAGYISGGGQGVGVGRQGEPTRQSPLID